LKSQFLPRNQVLALKSIFGLFGIEIKILALKSYFGLEINILPFWH